MANQKTFKDWDEVTGLVETTKEEFFSEISAISSTLDDVETIYATKDEVNGVEERLNTLLDSDEVNDVIDTFKEVEDFLKGVSNEKTLTGIVEAAADDAKDYADKLVKDEDGKVLFDAAGAADDALNDAKKYADENFQPKGEYLTEHQSLDDYALKSNLPSLEGLVQEQITIDNNELEKDNNGQGFATKSWVYSHYCSSQAIVEIVDDVQKAFGDVEKMFKLVQARIDNLERLHTDLVVASDAKAIASIAEPEVTNLVLTSNAAIESMTANKEYKSIAIVGGDTEKSINLNAKDGIVIDGMEINGGQDGGNGKINFTADTMTIKNVAITAGTTSYNVFEGSQKLGENDLHIEQFDASEVTVDDVELKHNVCNIYTPQNDAVITIKDSKFNLNVANSNVLRMSNYLNSTGVTINFENIDWTYENVEASDEDKKWAGLMIFQPASQDAALNGDTQFIETWKINVKNCRYNGQVVNSNNFGEMNQVVYLYNIGKSGQVSDAFGVIPMNFIND